MNLLGLLAATTWIADTLNAAGGKAITTATTFTAPATAKRARFVRVECLTNDCCVTIASNATLLVAATTIIGRRVWAGSYQIFQIPESAVATDQPAISVVSASGTTNVNVFWAK